MRLNRHRLQVRDYFSAITLRISLKWLYWLIVGFIGACFIPLLFVPIMELIGFSFEGSGLMTHGHAFTFFILVLGFFGLKQSPVCLETDEQSERKKEEEQKKTMEK